VHLLPASKTNKESMKYTLRPCNGSQPELKVQSDNVPRAGETIMLRSTPFSVVEVRHIVEPDDSMFKTGTPFVDIVVLYE